MATITNKQSITSAANQADIFLLSQAGTRFINRGNLATTGAQSSTIDITADQAVVQNFGSLSTSGANSPTLLAGHRDDGVDGVSIYNFGAITNTAPFVDVNGNGAVDLEEYFPDGIQYHGTNGLIDNRGTITVPTRSGAAIGILASDTTIVNRGEIEANIFGIVVDNFGGGRDRNTVTNEGLIHVTGGTSGAAIDVRSNDNLVVNEGDIVAEGDEYIGILIQGIGNSVENGGTVSVSGDHATAVYLYGAGHTLINDGTISVSLSPDSAAVRFGADQPAGVVGTLINNGTVLGQVYGTDATEIVANYGLLGGDVRLGAGDDVYVAGKNSLNGPTDLGAGADLLVLEKGFGGFSAGGFLLADGDKIDVSGLGITSFEQVMTYATQTTGRTIVFDFGGGSVVVVNGEGYDYDLSDFSADNFVFAQNGATAPLTSDLSPLIHHEMAAFAAHDLVIS